MELNSAAKIWNTRNYICAQIFDLDVTTIYWYPVGFTTIVWWCYQDSYIHRFSTWNKNSVLLNNHSGSRHISIYWKWVHIVVVGINI